MGDNMDVVNIIKVLWGLFIIYLTIKAIKVIIAIREGKPMTAMVVDYAEEHDDDNISYYPIIEYTDEYGNLRREKLNVSDSQKEYGERILYLYKGKFYQKKSLIPAIVMLVLNILPFIVVQIEGMYVISKLYR